jgi:hypothetical protein
MEGFGGKERDEFDRKDIKRPYKEKDHWSPGQVKL